MAEYTCECGQPAVLYVRRLEEDGSAPRMMGPNDKAFACCARHVNRALRYILNGQRAATCRLMLVRDRRITRPPSRAGSAAAGNRTGH